MSSLSGNQGPRIRAARTGEAAPYEAITLDRLTPVIGAEIGGVDLGNLTNRQFDEIHRALAHVASKDTTCDEAVTALIDLANEGGGPDNITCVVAHVVPEGE